MATVFIQWCKKYVRLERVVISPELAGAASIRDAAAKIGIPVADSPTELRVHDLCVDSGRGSGWGLPGGDVMLAGCDDACLVPSLLYGARVLTRRWAIEFRNGGYFQMLEADNSGPVETAMTFDDKLSATRFMDANSWIYMNGGMAKQLL